MAKDLYLYQDDVAEVDVNVVKNLDIKNYGHSDILNKKLSDFMHNTRLSVGNKNRGVESREKYFDKIFSFSSFVRHSWSTVTKVEDARGVKVEWDEPDDEADEKQANIKSFFTKKGLKKEDLFHSFML